MCLLIAVAAMCGCDAFLGSWALLAGDCTLPVYVPPVTAQITDANTGEPVTQAVATLSDGENSATATGDYVTFDAEWIINGTFTLTVEADGYVSQTIGDVVVSGFGCQVSTHVDVLLIPAGLE